MTETPLTSLLNDRHSGSPASRIVRLLSERGSLSAAQIARISGLARSTVSTALVELRTSGMVVEVGAAEEGSKGVGRPATSLMLNPDAGTCVGVHLKSSSICVILADVSHSVISEQTLELGRDYTPAQAASVTKEAIANAYAEHGLPMSGLLGVGISVSGPVSPGGYVRRASIVPLWAGVNIKEVFEPVLERPIFTDNESNCAAIAEMMWGAAVGYNDFALFKIDIGVGGALVSGGRVLTGVAGSAGEFGHISLDPQGDLCRCGNRGCLELSASFNRPLEQLSRMHHRPMSMDDAIQLAEQGDVGARRLIEDAAEVAGRGLGIVGTLFNPPLIIIGGRMALAGDILLAPLIRSYERHTLIKSSDVDEAMRTRISIGKFTENDSLLGAVGLVLRSHGRLY